ncbi:MAG: diphthine synthase [archaeon]|nr:diphthine synthase [archaeon]
MVLNLIGLGLSSEKDISVRGLELIKESDYVYMEFYTSILTVDVETLSKFYGKEIILADREMIENDFDDIIMSKAKDHKVSVLVVGDPFSATTHMDLYLRCINAGIKVEVVNNASIMNSIGVTGMTLYRFGETVSIPYFTERWRPYSFYPKICVNYLADFHTLVLLDIKVKEISEENLIKGKKIYDPPRFMPVKVGLEQLLEASKNCEKEEYRNLINENSLCYGVARIGAPDQIIACGTIKEIMNKDFGKPLHSIVICAKNLHSMEKEMFEYYSKKK